MKYWKSCKYQVAEDEIFQTDFRPAVAIVTKRIELNCYGVLTVREGYAWDGTSGPVIDRDTNQTASLAHDALYQLMRTELIDYSLWREADMEFKKLLIVNGAWRSTVWIDMAGLALAKGRAAHPKNRKKVYSAP
mgnify:CR=1 FL=1